MPIKGGREGERETIAEGTNEQRGTPECQSARALLRLLYFYMFHSLNVHRKERHGVAVTVSFCAMRTIARPRWLT